MIVRKNLEQGSEEWFRARLGCATASAASKIITSTGKLSASRVGYAREIALECEIASQGFKGNDATEHGNYWEPYARAHFERVQNVKVQEVGFVTREDRIIGCSPDGLIADEDGNWVAGLEIKCPFNASKHIDYLLDGGVPTAYKAQVHWSMAITGLPWYFMSFLPNPERDENSPERPPFQQLIVKVEPDEFTEKVAMAQDQFLPVFREEYGKVIKALYGEGGLK